MLLQLLSLGVGLKQSLSCNVLTFPLFSEDNISLWVIGAEAVVIFICKAQLQKASEKKLQEKTFVGIAPIQKLHNSIISKTGSKKMVGKTF